MDLGQSPAATYTPARPSGQAPEALWMRQLVDATASLLSPKPPTYLKEF